MGHVSCRGKRCTVWSEVLSPLSIRSTGIRPMTPRQRTQCAFESEVLISSKIRSSFRTDFGSTQRTGLELIKTEHWLFYSASRPWLPEPPSRCSCERFCPRKNSPRNTHRGKQHPKGFPNRRTRPNACRRTPRLCADPIRWTLRQRFCIFRPVEPTALRLAVEAVLRVLTR